MNNATESAPKSPLAEWQEFPKIGLIVDDKKKYYRLSEATAVWCSLFAKVEDANEVLEADFSVRKMTDEENRAFATLADEYEASK